MRINHPAIGRERYLTPEEETAVRLFLAEEEGRYGGPEHSEWWQACKSAAAITGMEPARVREISWSWAGRFAPYCVENDQADQDDTDRDKARMYNGF
jgi:hypothetical protein